MRHSAWPGLLLLAVTLSAVADDRPPGAAARPGSRSALLIGVQKYDSEDLHDLECADKDVEDLAETLRASGYKGKDITLLNTRGKDVPTAKRIREAIKEFVGRDYGKDDIVLIAFSGHGVQIGKKFYFCPAGARLALDARGLEGLISIDELYQELKTCKAGYRILLTDCCRNNPLTGRGARVIREVAGDEAPAFDEGLPRDVVLITSCSPGQKAYEDREAFGRGVFFHFVIEGLKGKADLNEDGKVTRAEMEAYLRLQMARHKSKQTPETVTRSRLDPPIVDVGMGPPPKVLLPVARVTREQFVYRSPAPAIHGNAKFAVTVDGEQMQLFDLERRRLVGKSESGAWHGTKCVFGQSGNVFVGANSAANFISPQTGKIASSVKLKFTPGVLGMSRDEKRYFVAAGGEIVVLDLLGRPIESFDHGAHAVTAAALTSAGESLVTGASNGMVLVHDVDKGKRVHELEGHTKPVVAIHVSRDGSQALTVCGGGKLIRWNLEKGAALDTSDVSAGTDLPYSVGFQLDGRRAIIGYHGGTVGIVDIPATGKAKLVATSDKHARSGAPAAVAMARDGSRAISVATTELWIYELPAE